MKRLSENVFQFPLCFGGAGDGTALAFPLMVPLAIMFQGTVGLIFGILLIFPYVIWVKIYIRNLRKNGLILDKEKGCISIYKWTWNLKAPQKFDVYPLDEILSFGTDIDVKTETKLVNEHTRDAHWKTTETRTHNIVLHGKFGSKRVSLANLDDWNLFQTLVSSDE
jgi:hypothetical protein